MFDLDERGREIGFSPTIYSEAYVLKLLPSDESESLTPIAEFALCRDRKAFIANTDEMENQLMAMGGNVFEASDLKDQFIYACGCLERIKEKTNGEMNSDAIKGLRNFNSYLRCKRLSTVVTEFEQLKRRLESDLMNDPDARDVFSALDTLLRALGQQEFYKARKQWRKYAVEILRLRIRVQRKKLNRKNHDTDEKYNIFRQLYWWLQILRLREEHNIGAWEGIRIVSDAATNPIG